MSITWYPVTRFPLETDLVPLLSLLSRQGYQHHVTEEDGQQQLWIADEHQVLEVGQLSSEWYSGEFSLPEVEAVSPKSLGNSSYALAASQLLRFSPVSLIFIFLGLLGTILITIDTPDLAYSQVFLFQPIQNGAFQAFSVAWDNGQYWRLLTPIFLHFGLLHIVFNGVILWAMGNRIERVKGSWHYLLVLLITGVFANLAQYWSQPNAAFGGLSGAVYGVIGYIALYQTFIFHPVLQFNRAAIAFFVVWLVIGFTGAIDLFIPGGIANAAHLGGLLAGFGLGALAVFVEKAKGKST